MNHGKASREFFDAHVAPNLGADRDDVLLGPTHGADFGVVDLGDRVLALASDPLFVLSDLGVRDAAWFAFHIAVSDVALSGLPPTHLALDWNLPVDADPGFVGEVFSVFDAEARDLGTSIVTGHTGAYEGCSFPTVGGATALALGDRDSLVRPTGATPGDRVVVTKGPAVETVGVIASVFGDKLDLPAETVDAARDRLRDASPVRDALTAAATGEVTAMHDATERGLANGLHELAAASGVGVDIERANVPTSPGVREVCEFLGIEPWTASSSGTVVLAARDSAPVVDALADEGIPAADVGRVTESGVHADSSPLPEPEADPFWPAYADLRDA
ncbi:AIR synthase family protein [Salarchaeum sp. JOR-1]|uniref:AIR synthase family protein n=1 Tax=Salarchaeum sp. JOR-1 TaxID=2599399 RepID=UPI001198C97F|nr:AIR synthase family protein [Salarchaeum sp. JOR-1]QDX39880.1 hydrogenase expression protein [Salarchaeum sp. JOR-1]